MQKLGSSFLNVFLTLQIALIFINGEIVFPECKTPTVS